MINMKKYLILIFILFASCGFKLVDNSNFDKLSYKSLTSKGDKKINFLLRNNLIKRISQNTENGLISIDINSNKIRKIGEKNIKNQITKYRIEINTKMKIIFTKTNKEKEFYFQQNGNYDVSNSQTTTNTNKNKLEDYLTNQISDKILRELLIISNDL